MTVKTRAITTETVVAYSQCPRKAYLLLCTGEKGRPHEYVRILEKQRQAVQRKYLNILRQENTDVQPYSLDTLTGKHDVLINAILEASGLVAKCAILNKVRTHSALGRYSYEPTIFVGTHSIRKEQKLALFFVSRVLEQVQDKHPASGRIIGLDSKSHKVKLENGPKTLVPLLEPVQEWAADASPEPPPLILNKHCPTCQFFSLCRAKAEQEDHLSLLDGISTRKALNKYEKKGLFTVKQLSYTFKPRRRKKRAKNPPPVVHKPELQALAIREGKIYLQELQELPELTRQLVELFLDIEGVPDRQFYYLIGLLVSSDDTITYHPFWADTAADEAQMWRQFLAKANQYPDVPIYHYGSFEPRALAKLAKRYNTGDDGLANRLVNVNKHVYGKVYFPVYSNRLKEIGAFIGATWTSPAASGLQSLVWRHHWEETRSAEYKDLLLTYNEEDCRVLKLLTDELSKIKHSADTLSEVDFANRPKRHATEVGKEVHNQFEALLKFAHADYDKKKISFRQEQKNLAQKKETTTRRVLKRYRNMPEATKFIQVPMEEFCPTCKNLLRLTRQVARKLIIDLVLTRKGIQKNVIEYRGIYGYCSKCYKSYAPPDIRKFHVTELYGRGFKAWHIYQRVVLRLPYESIGKTMEDQFNELGAETSIPNFIREFSHYYAETNKGIIRWLMESPFIHVDETTINIRGIGQYVWVFTDGKNVVFQLTENREAAVVHEFLSNYRGILISDFYPSYDSVQCRQQKCWVHLIRDINDDLWAAPFDTEFEVLVSEVRDLIISIMETVQERGLIQQHLSEFKEQVDEFYKTVIIDKRYKSELTNKYQQRFLRYQHSLFTFLEHDGIPWHNNAAERALRHITIQEKISGYFHDSVIRDYLRLLGIRQTCQFQGKSFFKFLFSGETDLNKFEANKRKAAGKIGRR